MNRRLALVFVFVLASVIDVRVRAAKKGDDHHAPEKSPTHRQEVGPTTQPEHCLPKADYPCAVMIDSKRQWLWQWPQGRAEFRPGTVAILLAQGDIKLIEGEVILYSKLGAAWLRTIYGDVAVSESTVLVRREANADVEVTTLNGGAQLFPVGGKKSLDLPAGYRNWLGGVELNGQASTGIPQAANKDRVLKVWAKTFRGDKEEFFTRARDFHQAWLGAIDSAGLLHRELIDRRIASIAADRARRARLRALREKRMREMRQLFRKKNYLD